MKALFTVSALLLATILYAQNINYGFKFGVNISNISGNLGEESRSRPSIHIGGFYEDKTSDNFAISPELIYSQQGIKFEGATSAEGFNELILNYVSLAVNGKFFLGDNFIPVFGPQFSYLVFSDLEGDGTSGNDIGAAFKNIDYGFNAGFMVRLNSGFTFGLRYYFGLENIIEDSRNFNRVEGNNRVLQLSLEYLIK